MFSDRKMLYRKYRPQKFAELVGLESVRKTLLSQVKDKKVAHAYLFAGPRGTGKTTTARILAKAINCPEIKAGEPCGNCGVCKQVEEGRYLDLIEIDAASHRGIDDVRALRERIKLAPSVGQYKIYIIDEAHMLTPEAFNALLKTLEEPPAHVIFILCTTESYKLPETIRSRCQRFNFERASVKHIVGRLADICKKEEVQLDEGELVEIAKASGGGFRDAETLLEQVITGGEKVSDLVGRATPENLEEFFDFLIAGDTATALIYVNDLYDKGVSMESFNQKVLEYLRDLLLIKVGVGESLVEVGKERFTKMQTQATSLPPQQLSNMINKFTQSYENLAQSSIPTLPLEVAVVGVVGATVEEGAKAQNESDQQLGDTKPLSAEVAKPDDQWQELKQRVKPLNHSVAALLRSCEPGKVNGRKFVIHAFYPFHKERLEEPKNRAILEEMVEAVYGKKLKLQVVLGKEVGSGE
ncbi:hypothetical protein COY35_00505 [candidate division WWE3 bacterium CG_4_10_14_0_2_um_filter_47_8]|nr:MAG: hypothetical protein COY35_00505 [candidate division WWE3 bacterium CG_4_10_14_0_2_um_filter_47_8]